MLLLAAAGSNIMLEATIFLGAAIVFVPLQNVLALRPCWVI